MEETKKITIEDLAVMVQIGFNDVTGKMSLVKNAFDCFTKGIENGFTNAKLN